MKQRLLYSILLTMILGLALTQLTNIPVSSATPNASIFPDAPNVIALFEFDGNVADSSGNGNDGVLIGGQYVSTPLGQGLKVVQGQDNGMNWSEHADKLVHPYTVEIILTPQNTNNWKKLFGFDDQNDNGWYYLNDGIQAYPNPVLGSGQVIGNQLHYLAFVSTDADQVDVYFQGELLGSTPATFTAPPTEAIFFKDDTITGGSEGLEAVVEAVRISSQARTMEEITAVQTLLTGASSIGGMVTNEAAEPLAGVVVNAYQRLGDDLWVSGGSAETNESGQYMISGLFSGTYYVHFADTTLAYQPEYYDDVSDIEAADEIAVGSETQVTGIDAALADPAPPQIGVTGPTVGVDPVTGEVTIPVPRGAQEEVTITKEITCDTGSPSNVQLLIDTKAFPMTAGEGDLYSVTFTTPDDLPTTATSPLVITIEYDCDGDTTTLPPVGEIMLFDPSGDVTDAETGDLIEGAVVNLYRVPNAIPDRDGLTNDCRTVDTRPASPGGTFGAWSAVSQASITDGVWVNPDFGAINATPEISPTINPQVTGANGRYAWDVAEGCWYVEVSAEGYETIVSPIVGVPPEVTDLDVALTREMTGSTTYIPFLRQDIPEQAVPAAVDACQLTEAAPFGTVSVGLGFPTVNGRAPSVGAMRAKLIFVDFPDAPASQTTQELYTHIPNTVDVFTGLSYGRMDLQLEPVHQWFRVNQPVDDWTAGLLSPPYDGPFKQVIQQVDPVVDFTGVDVVYVLMSDTYTTRFLNAATQRPPGYFMVDGTSITNMVIGSGINDIYGAFPGPRLMAHEFGHTLGLPDLYDTSVGDSPYMGQWDTMANTYGPEPQMIAYQRWKLGWLDDTQIFCQQSSDETVYLKPMQETGGVKAVMVPLSSTRMVVVESHRASGYKEGALVHVIDSSIETGTGPIVAYPDRGTEKDDAPLVAGESVTVEGVTIEVIEAGSGYDLVRVTRSGAFVQDAAVGITPNNTTSGFPLLIETLHFNPAALD